MTRPRHIVADDGDLSPAPMVGYDHIVSSPLLTTSKPVEITLPEVRDFAALAISASSTLFLFVSY